MSLKVQSMPWSPEVRDASSPVRAAFIESHVDLVRYIALRISNRLPAGVEIEDLVHDGILGLMNAVERFDPAREVRFRTYAETRIRGAILDGLRQKDWRPRSIRHRRRNLDSVLGDLSSRLGRAPREEEIAAALGLDLEEYRLMLADLNSGPLLSIEELPNGADPTIPDSDQPNLPLERSETLKVLADEITRLPERESRVLALYYFESLNMKEVGAVLGVTESRVCQLHSQAAARLRVALHGRLHATVPARVGRK